MVTPRFEKAGELFRGDFSVIEECVCVCVRAHVRVPLMSYS